MHNHEQNRSPHLDVESPVEPDVEKVVDKVERRESQDGVEEVDFVHAPRHAGREPRVPHKMVRQHSCRELVEDDKGPVQLAERVQSLGLWI